MTDDANFEDRLRATFQTEAAELARRKDRASSDDAMRSAALVEEIDDHGSNANRRMLVPLLAAAVLLVAGVAGVIALARPSAEVPTELATAGATARALVTATPTPTPTITVVPTLVETPEAGTEGARPPLPTAVLVTPVPTPPPPPTPTPVPATPVPTGTPAPQDPPRSGDFCMLRTIGPFAEGTCGLEAIGAVVDGWLPVQLVTSAGLQNADLVPVDALAPGVGIEAPRYVPGLSEVTWCVSDIVAPDTLNVRAGPSTDQLIVGELAEGQCRIFRSDVPHPFGNWTWVALDQPDGQMLTGWASSLYLREEVQPVDDTVPRRPILVRAEPFGSDLDIPDVSEFRFVDGTVLIGNPDSDGRLQIPANIDPVGLIGSAPLPGDRFCAFTGRLEAIDGDGYHVLRVLQLCA
jgi:hypothetical protein